LVGARTKGAALAREQLDDVIDLAGRDRPGSKIAASEDNGRGTGTGGDYRAIEVSHERAIGFRYGRTLLNLDK
jgi:hypothetical protein